MSPKLCVLHDRPGPFEPTYLSTLAATLPVTAVRWRRNGRLDRLPVDRPWVVDFEAPDTAKLAFLRSNRAANDMPRLFVVSSDDRGEIERARYFGATGTIHRPVDALALRRMLEEAFSGAAKSARKIGARTSAPPANERSADPSRPSKSDILTTLTRIGIITGVLDEFFASIALDRDLSVETVISATEMLVPTIERVGLAIWLDLIREHHAETHLHSLLVMGIATRFSQKLGFDDTSRVRAAVAGLLHDVGKCRVPKEILSKPGSLSEDEFAAVRRHCRDGWEILKAARPPLTDETMDAILHHHEHLDGSGYPDGLSGEKISVLTRIITISDVYGALAEKRAYRQALTVSQIRPILETMAIRGRIDAKLLETFPFDDFA